MESRQTLLYTSVFILHHNCIIPWHSYIITPTAWTIDLPYFSKNDCYAIFNVAFVSLSAPVQSNLCAFSWMKTNSSHKSKKYNWDSLNITQNNGLLFWTAVTVEPKKTGRNYVLRHWNRVQSRISWLFNFLFYFEWQNKDFQCPDPPNPNDPFRIRIQTEAT